MKKWQRENCPVETSGLSYFFVLPAIVISVRLPTGCPYGTNSLFHICSYPPDVSTVQFSLCHFFISNSSFFISHFLYRERCINDLRLLLRMHFRVTGGCGSAWLAADHTIVDVLQVHLQEGGCTHVQRFFLYPEPGGLVVFVVQFFQLFQWQRIQLFQPYNGGIFFIFFQLTFGQIEIYLTAAEQYFPYARRIFYRHVIDHFLKSTV